jgi:uncharacterized membrane protein YhfC
VSRPPNPLALIQGIYFLITGIWPLLHIDSFQKITGPKTDLWLVKTVGALVTVVGAVLSLAAWQQRVSPLIRLLAIGNALALGAIDVIYVARRRIRPVYLLDALLEAAFIVAWLLKPSNKQ